jgi:hypothetical protein
MRVGNAVVPPTLGGFDRYKIDYIERNPAKSIRTLKRICAEIGATPMARNVVRAPNQLLRSKKSAYR